MPLKIPAGLKTSFAVKLAERMFWTGAQAAIAVGFIHLAELPVVWIVPVATVLAYAKGQIARHVGDSNDPATLPYGV